MLLCVLSALDIVGVPDYVITRHVQSLCGALLAAISFHLNVYEAYTGYLPASWTVLWSLSIEEVFYLGFPFACLLARRAVWPMVLPLALLALSVPVTRMQNVSNEILREQAYLYGMGAIATGVLAALLAHRWQISLRFGVVLTLTGSVAWMAVIFIEDPIWSVLGEWTLLLLTFGTAILLIGLDVWRPTSSSR